MTKPFTATIHGVRLPGCTVLRLPNSEAGHPCLECGRQVTTNWVWTIDVPLRETAAVCPKCLLKVRAPNKETP